MKQLLFLLTISLLVACGGGGGGGSSPTPGNPITNPPPPPPPDPDPVVVLEVEIGESGDRFYPVEVDITYTIDGVPQSYDYTLTMGWAEETDTGILVYGDGRLGDGILTINEEEYQFTIIAEPTCGVPNSTGTTSSDKIDCAGYFHSPPTDEGFIYYGEDDTRVVEWEIVYMHWDSKCAGYEEDDFGVLKNSIGPCDVDDWIENERDQLLRGIAKMNEIYSRMGVYVKLVPVRLQKGYFLSGGDWRPDIGSDLILWNDGQPTTRPGLSGIVCGWAGYASPRAGRPLQPYSACGIFSTLHEIGHTVGLSHGPYNNEAPGNGITFPDFGHGMFSPCPGSDSIMSYGTQRMFTNSLKTCEEITGISGDLNAGLRAYGGSDEAYAINRIRYNVALINNNRAWIDPEAVEDTPNLMGYDIEYNVVRDVYPPQDAIDKINEYRDEFEIDVLGPHEQYK